MVEEAFANGRVTLSMLATAAGVSVPTMRKHLHETGDRITFRRGRTGGMTLSTKVSPHLHRVTEAHAARQAAEAAAPVAEPIRSNPLLLIRCRRGNPCVQHFVLQKRKKTVYGKTTRGASGGVAPTIFMI